jgi:hypothetical protein
MNVPADRVLRVTVCSLALWTAGSAQDVVPSQPPPAAPRAEAPVSVSFPGGTLPQYVQALRAASEGANIVVPDDAGDVHVPPLTLKNADLLNALDVLADLVGDDVQVRVRMLKSSQGQPVYALRVARARSAAPRGSQIPGSQVGMSAGMPDPADLVVRVFSLRMLTHPFALDSAGSGTTMKPETILSAIETGLSFSASGPKPVVRYHTDSGILFVQGTPKHVHVVQEILSSLNEDVARARQAAAMARTTNSATREAGTR